MLANPLLIDDDLRRLVHDLGPFFHRDRHAPPALRARFGVRPAVFSGAIARGIRLELVLPDDARGLSADALLMPLADGGWEVFDDAGLVATYEADAVRVSVRR